LGHKGIGGNETANQQEWDQNLNRHAGSQQEFIHLLQKKCMEDKMFISFCTVTFVQNTVHSKKYY
jgi:hypothetical protein